MEDSKIVELFLTRDETAINESKAKYGRLLHSIAYGILANHEDCEECVSDTFYKAWTNIPPERPEYLSAYLGRIVRNLSINLWKANHAQKRFHPADVSLDEIGDILPVGNSVEEEIDARELARHISDWLRALEKEERILFLRRYWYGQSLKELAHAQNTTANKLAGRMYRLRQNLKDSLEQKGISL